MLRWSGGGEEWCFGGGGGGDEPRVMGLRID